MFHRTSWISAVLKIWSPFKTQSNCIFPWDPSYQVFAVIQIEYSLKFCFNYVQLCMQYVRVLRIIYCQCCSVMDGNILYICKYAFYVTWEYPGHIEWKLVHFATCKSWKLFLPFIPLGGHLFFSIVIVYESQHSLKLSAGFFFLRFCNCRLYNVMFLMIHCKGTLLHSRVRMQDISVTECSSMLLSVSEQNGFHTIQ